MKLSRKNFLLGGLGLFSTQLVSQIKSKSIKEEKIAIVGAGFSGMYAGHLLATQGLSFEIFEASSRIGGRVRPLHDFADFPVELGGEEIHGNKSLYYKLLEEKKVPLIKKEFENYYSIKGKLLEESEADLDPNFSKIQDAIQSLKFYEREDISVEDFLTKKSIPKSYFHIAEAEIGNEYGVNIKNLSALGVARNIQNWKAGEEVFRIRNRSNLSVLEEITGIIQKKTYLNTQIKKIDFSKDKVVLMDQLGNEYTASRVLITVPISVLKDGDISFHPALPSFISSAIQKISIGSGIKIVLKFSKRFWQANTGIIVGEGWIPKFYAPGYLRGTLNNVLVGYVVGDWADKLSELGKEVYKLAVKELDSLFGKKIASNSLVNYFIMDWKKEPFIRGVTSYPSIGETDAREKLSYPVEEKIFFAGEATNPIHYGTMHGAIESAQRTVSQIISFL